MIRDVIHLSLPIEDSRLQDLKCGDYVYLSGILYTARDAAHKRLFSLLEKGIILPFNIKGAGVYYCGPSPASPGKVIGSAGPTSSYRMDAYTPALLDAGLKVMIGKGERSCEVVDAVRRNSALYLGTVGGAGAYLSSCIKKVEIIAYPDLDSEAIRKLTVTNFPSYVLIDSRGNCFSP